VALDAATPAPPAPDAPSAPHPVHVPADATELYFYFFYALLCFFLRNGWCFKGGLGVKGVLAAGCALSFAAVKLCVSNVLCLPPPFPHPSHSALIYTQGQRERGAGRGSVKFKTSKRKRKWAARDAR